MKRRALIALAALVVAAPAQAQAPIDLNELANDLNAIPDDAAPPPDDVVAEEPAEPGDVAEDPVETPVAPAVETPAPTPEATVEATPEATPVVEAVVPTIAPTVAPAVVVPTVTVPAPVVTPVATAAPPRTARPPLPRATRLPSKANGPRRATPPPARPASTYPVRAAVGIVVVQPGDSLSAIARRQLGAGASETAVMALARRLWALNAARIGTGDWNVILPGQKLLMPDA